MKQTTLSFTAKPKVLPTLKKCLQQTNDDDKNLKRPIAENKVVNISDDDSPLSKIVDNQALAQVAQRIEDKQPLAKISKKKKEPETPVKKTIMQSFGMRQSPRVKKMEEQRQRIQKEEEEKRQKEEETKKKKDEERRKKKEEEKQKKMEKKLKAQQSKAENAALYGHLKVNTPTNVDLTKLSPSQIKMPSIPPLNPMSRNIVIAIDMEPEKWRSLSPGAQAKIIEQKKKVAAKQLYQMNLKTMLPKQPIQQQHIRQLNLSPTKTSFINRNSNVLPQNPTKIIIRSSPTNPLKAPSLPTNHHSVQMNRANTTGGYSLQRTILKQPPVQPFILNPSPQQQKPKPQKLPQKPQHFQAQPFSHHNSISSFNPHFTQIANQKRDDEELINMKPLPPPKLVRLPVGFTHQMFGDVLMLTEFANTMKKLLDTNDEPDLTTDVLMRGLVRGSSGSLVVSKMLLAFLHILLATEDYKIRALKIELADLPLTEFTVSFLVENYLKSELIRLKKERRAKQFEEEAALKAKLIDECDGEEGDDFFFEDLLEKKKKSSVHNCEPLQETQLRTISKELETKEFYDLSSTSQVTVLTYMLMKIFDGEEFDNYIEDVAKQRTDAWSEKLTLERNVKERREKRSKERFEISGPIKKTEEGKIGSFFKKDDENKSKVNINEENKEKTDERNPNKEKGDEEKVIREEKNEDENTCNDKENPYEGLTRRQISALESEKEKEMENKKLMEEADIQDKKDEQQKRLKQMEKEEKEDEQKDRDMERKLVNAVKTYHESLRLEPMGFDRARRMYWLFTNSAPGLFVYETLSMINNSSSDRWYHYDNMADIDKLISSLTIRGHREHKLKANLRSNYGTIKEAIKSFEELKKHPTTNSQASAKQNVISDGENKSSSENKEDKSSSEIKTESDITALTNRTDKSSDVEIREKRHSEIIVPKTEDLEKDEGKSEKLDKDSGNISLSSDETSTPIVNTEEDISVKKSPLNSVSSDEKEKSEDDDLGKINNQVSEKSEKPSENQAETLEKSEKPSENQAETLEKSEKPSENQSKTLERSDKHSDTTQKEEDRKTEHLDAYQASLEAIKEDMIESMEKISRGRFGDAFEVRHLKDTVPDIQDMTALKPLMTSVQASVYAHFLLEPMSNTETTFTNDWLSEVNGAKTLSQLHTLFGIFENCVDWEKSQLTIEKQQCKVCKKESSTSSRRQHTLQCCKCHSSYHATCIKQPSTSSLRWTCPECQNETRSSREETSQKKEKAEASDSSNNDELCHICESDGYVILCDTCPLAFHFDCHTPPLRRPPRGDWSCYICRNKQSGRRGTTVKKKVRSKYTEVASESEDSEVEEKKSYRKRAAPAKTKAQAKKRKVREIREVTSSEEESDDEKNENEVSPILGNKRPRYAKDGVSKRKESESSKKTSKNIETASSTKSTARSSRGSRHSRRGNNYEVVACEKILHALTSSPNAWPFLQPVNPKDAADYFTIIEQPMDLSEVKRKLGYLQYEDALQFKHDVMLVFQNAAKYNDPCSDVGVAGEKLSEEFTSLIGQHLPELNTT